MWESFDETQSKLKINTGKQMNIAHDKITEGDFDNS